MKKILLFFAFITVPWIMKAQEPNLPTKGTLNETLFTQQTFSSSSSVDTLMSNVNLPSDYTLELLAKVNSAAGRGLDIETRNSAAKGVRLTLDAAHLKLSSSLNNMIPITESKSGEDQTIRLAVKGDSVHIYQNGAYIISQPLSEILDIEDGVESATITGNLPGPNLISGWAGAAGDFNGSPDNYGWDYNGTSSTTLFNTANGSGGVRYMDVSSSSNVHTYNGTDYTGRTLFVRWDGNSIENTVYTYPVVLEANTTYDFSMLHAFFSNATGTKSLTVGIGTSTSVADNIASHTFNSVGTKELVREGFSFTSDAAGTYYLTVTGNWGLYTIAELSLNKYLPGNLIPNWAGIAPNNSGAPSDYSWGFTGSTTNLFNTANSGSGVRYLDVTSGYTYDGSTFDGRFMYIRWDGSPVQNTVFNYPVMLEANTTYNFSMLHAYVTNATGNKSITVGIGTDTGVSNRIDAHTFTTSGTKVFNKEAFTFTSDAAGLYYLTFTGDWGLYAISDLSLTKIEVPSRFIFGKNYVNGAVAMEINSVRYEAGAYAPTGIIIDIKENVVVTGDSVSYLPTSHTNFSISGDTDMHLTGPYSPLIDSYVALNSNDSWLYFDNIKPSIVISDWLDKVTVNGTTAVNGTNVRIAIYKNGTVVIPNGNQTSEEALEVFTQTNYGGSSTTYEIETYHNNLGSFDNAIKSFKLKKGYMATLATNADGSGYSRVFIANDDDLLVNIMPEGLDATTSFIRIFRWDWISKKGKAGWDPNKVDCTWYYDWNIGGAPSVDHDYAAIRQNGGWPSWESINNKPNINHLLGFNEPDRPDQANMSVDDAVAQWPEMMKSGLRIGSPAPANPESSWLSQFLSKTDSLNLRVDFVAIHCYWGGQSPQQWYNRLKNIHNTVGRPLWITEWNNGANWTNESWPADSTQAFQKQLNDMKGILKVLDTASFVERYAEYDWVEYKRAMVLGDTLTPFGKYYKANKSDFAYKTATAFTHTWHLASTRISHTLDEDDYTLVTLKWQDFNGENGSKYILERQIDGVDSGFIPIQEYTSYDDGGNMTYLDDIYTKAFYRVKVFNLDESEFVYSSTYTIEIDDSPVPPSSLTGSVLSSSITHLNWVSDNTARSYNLKRSTSSSGPFTTISSRTHLLEYEDTGLTPNTTYYYVVTSLNSAGESTNSTVLELTTNALVTPSGVVNPHIASGDTKIVLTWDFIYDAEYTILRSSSASGPFTNIATGVSTIRYEDTGLSNGTTYYYKVEPYNSAGTGPQTSVLTGTPVLGQHLHIDFNENTGTFTQDTWGGYNGKIVNAATWTDGKDGTGGALQVIKSNTSYIQLAEGAVSTLNDFTVATWIKLPSDQGNNTRVFDFGNGTGTYMILVPRAGTQVRYKITCAAGTNDRYINSVLPLDEWVHITISQQGATFKYYVNGDMEYSDTNATISPSDMGITPYNYLGKSQWPNDPYCDHTYDDFRIYNYALSDAQVEALAGSTSSYTFNTTMSKTTGVNNANIKLYPVPAKHVIHVSGDINSNCQYQLYNVLGTLVASGNVTDKQILVSDKISSGTYIIKLTDKNTIVLNQLIMIQK